MGLDAEDEADVAGGVPAVQVLGLGELGVAPQEHRAEAGPAAEVDGLIEVDVGPLVRGAVARAVDQEQRLGRVGQRDQEGVIAPGALVGPVDVALALGVGADQRAVGVDDRLVEELRRLHGPDAAAGPVEGLHQVQDVGHAEPAAEVALGGGVGDAVGAHRVEVDLVVAPQLDVLDLLAAGQEVEGDVQDVVALVVRQVPLEDVDVGIDVADQPGPTRQQEHGADAPGGEAAGAIGQLVVDVGGGHHGRVALRPGPVEDAVEDPPLPLVEDPAIALPRLLGVASGGLSPVVFSGILGDSGRHSKALVDWNSEDVFLPLLFQNLRGFSSFFSEFDADRL